MRFGSNNGKTQALSLPTEVIIFEFGGSAFFTQKVKNL